MSFGQQAAVEAAVVVAAGRGPYTSSCMQLHVMDLASLP